MIHVTLGKLVGSVFSVDLHGNKGTPGELVNLFPAVPQKLKGLEINCSPHLKYYSLNIM